MTKHDDVFPLVQQALVEALAVEPEEITMDAVLVDDLNAESIDFLDILFQLENQFSITLPRGELFPDKVLTDEQYVQDGKITEKGLQELRERMPFADLSPLEADPSIENFSRVITVRTICNFIESRGAPSAES